jgi:hypothetical protein
MHPCLNQTRTITDRIIIMRGDPITGIAQSTRFCACATLCARAADADSVGETLRDIILDGRQSATGRGFRGYGSGKREFWAISTALFKLVASAKGALLLVGSLALLISAPGEYSATTTTARDGNR